MGLSLVRDHDEEESAISEPDMLCVGVIMYDVGPIAVSGEIVFIPNECDGVIVPMEWWEARFMSRRSNSVEKLSTFFIGVVGSDSANDMGSGSCLMGPIKYLDMDVEGGVSSIAWLLLKEQEPSKSRVRALGVERRELGVKGSYAEEAEEKLVVVEGHDMDWLMLKPSSMSNRNSGSNCMVMIALV
jgi:hypothetical protein